MPAFLAAHLRRRFGQKSTPAKREGKHKSQEGVLNNERPPEQPSGTRLQPEEIKAYAATVSDLMKDGSSLEDVTAQFAGSLHPDDWIMIRGLATSQVEEKGS